VRTNKRSFEMLGINKSCIQLLTVQKNRIYKKFPSKKLLVYRHMKNNLKLIVSVK